MKPIVSESAMLRAFREVFENPDSSEGYTADELAATLGWSVKKTRKAIGVFLKEGRVVVVPRTLTYIDGRVNTKSHAFLFVEKRQ